MSTQRKEFAFATARSTLVVMLIDRRRCRGGWMGFQGSSPGQALLGAILGKAEEPSDGVDLKSTLPRRSTAS